MGTLTAVTLQKKALFVSNSSFITRRVYTVTTNEKSPSNSNNDIRNHLAGLSTSSPSISQNPYTATCISTRHFTESQIQEKSPCSFVCMVETWWNMYKPVVVCTVKLFPFNQPWPAHWLCVRPFPSPGASVTLGRCETRWTASLSGGSVWCFLLDRAAILSEYPAFSGLDGFIMVL